MSNQPKVTIIGAGIIGVCCALELQRAGCQVTLIDREEPGEGCSKGNAGVFAYDAVLPLITPGLLRRLPSMLFDPMSPLALGWRHLPFALPWMSRFLLNALPNRVSANTNALTQLLSRGEQAYEDLLQGTEARGLVHKTGWATVFEKEQTYRASLHEVEIKRRQGVRIETLSGGALRERLPDLNPEVKHGLFMPDCWSTVDPHRLVELLAKQLIRDGAGFRRAEVSAISEKGGVPHIVTESGDEPCERLLVATGAWSKKLAASAGDAIPLDTERGYHLMVQGNGINPAMPVMSGEHHFVTTSMTQGIRLAGTSELAGLKLPPNYRRADILLSHARRLWPALDDGYESRWMGFRPTLPDSLPVLGASPNIPGLYYAFGHQHLGLTMAAISAQAMTGLITNSPIDLDLSPYRPDRFQWS